MKSKRRGNWFDCSARREDITSKVYKPSSGTVLAVISNGSRAFLLVIIMNKVELSLWIEANYPLTLRGRPRKPLLRVGINDAEYATQPVVNGCQLCDPAYAAWRRMLKRAYSARYHEKQPTYTDVTVCTEWHFFMKFRKWWLVNYREGWQIGKDLLIVGNREYGPDACIYVPGWLNSFTIDSGASRGWHPIGVDFDNINEKYRSRCRNPITGKRKAIGYFTTPEAAYQAWLSYKLALAEQLKPEMDAIDSRIYPNVVTKIKLS